MLRLTLLLLTLLELGATVHAQQRIAVAPFTCVPTRGIDTARLARYATERFDAEIARSNCFTPVTGEPADTIAVGEITVLPRSKSGGEIRLTVTIWDPKTDAAINGAQEKEAVRAGRGQAMDEDSMKPTVNHLVKKVVQTLVAFRLPEASLKNPGCGPGEVRALLNRGMWDGVRPGMLFDVLRGGKRVARLVAMDVFLTDCSAVPVENIMGIMWTDQVRAVFPLTFRKDLLAPGRRLSIRATPIFPILPGRIRDERHAA